MGKKSGPKAPPPPDPYATAQAQGDMNKETAIAQANLNRINQVTPQGTLTYNQIGTNADGTPKYEQVMQYTPEQQALYDQQNQIAQALGGLAGDNISRVADAQSQDFNFNGMQPLQTVGTNPQFTSDIDFQGDLTKNVGGDYNETVKSASDAVYNQLASRLNPQYEQLEAQYRDRLINSGISENSDAYRREMDNFARQRTDAYNTAGNQSVLTGLQAQAQGFGQDMQNAALNNAAQDQGFQQALTRSGFGNQAKAQQMATDVMGTQFNNDVRQRQIEEAAYLRNMPLNDIAALLGTGGGVQAPSFGPVSQVGLDAPDFMGATYNSYNAQMNQYNQAQQARSQGLGSIFGLAGSLAPLAFSDRRLKENVKAIGKLANGLTTYAFNYIGDKKRQFGVMAQEAFKVRPEAVGEIDGYLYVDYRKVWA